MDRSERLKTETFCCQNNGFPAREMVVTLPNIAAAQNDRQFDTAAF